jgi:hypothetical protein
MALALPCFGQGDCWSSGIVDGSGGTNGSAATATTQTNSTIGMPGNWTWGTGGSAFGSGQITYQTAAHGAYVQNHPICSPYAFYVDKSTVGVNYNSNTTGPAYLLFNLPTNLGNLTQTVSGVWFTENMPDTSTLNADVGPTHQGGGGFNNIILFGNGTHIIFTCENTPNSCSGQFLDGSGNPLPSGQLVLTRGQRYWVTLERYQPASGAGATQARIYPEGSTPGTIGALIGQWNVTQGSGGLDPTIYIYMGDAIAGTMTSGGGWSYDHEVICYSTSRTCPYPNLPDTQTYAWSGILDPARATDWTKAGIAGGIPSGTWAQCVTGACNTVTSAGTSATAAQITAALASATANTHVDIAQGTYNFSTGQILFPTTGHVELRGLGSGADFVFTGGGATCGRSGNAFICGIDAANANITSTPTLTWTGGYAQGATSTTLSSTAGINTTSASLPTLLAYNQCDTGLSSGFGCTSGTNTDNGQMFISDMLFSSPNGCCGNGPGNIITNRGQMEIHVAASATGGTAVLSTPLIMPNWASGQTPAVLPIQSIATFGVNNVRIKNPTVAASVGISFQNAYNWWIQDAAVTDPNGKITWGMNCLGCAYGEAQSNYVYDISGSANPYGIRCMMCSFNLIDNNIVQQTGTPFSFDGSSSGNVISYNYIPNATFSPASNLLQAAFNSHAYNTMDLYEGNVATQQDNDGIHGTADFVTNFRPGYMGWWSQPSDPINTLTNAKNDASFDRYMADIFGLYGSSIYHTNYLISATCTNANTAVFLLGTACSYGIPGDALSKSTGLRFGNFDTVTNNTRFCGNSSSTRWSTTCSSTSEVPTAASTWPNPVPVKGDTGIGQSAPPASFYLSSAPSWYSYSGAVTPFPAMGPDVSSGNLSQCSGSGINTAAQFDGVPTTSASHCAGFGTTTLWGGHANAIPAVKCAQDVMGMPVDGSGSVLAFNPVSCYTGSAPPPPPPAPAFNMLVMTKEKYEDADFVSGLLFGN